MNVKEFLTELKNARFCRACASYYDDSYMGEWEKHYSIYLKNDRLIALLRFGEDHVIDLPDNDWDVVRVFRNDRGFPIIPEEVMNLNIRFVNIQIMENMFIPLSKFKLTLKR